MRSIRSSVQSSRGCSLSDIIRPVLLLFPVLLLVSCAHVDDNAAEIYQIPEYRSHDGVLDVTLTAKEQKLVFGNVTVDGAIYNGEYAGPVLRVQPGDVMKIKLVNQLSRATNLHTHGIRTSPLGNSDNMHIVVNAGDTFDYEIKIPASQPPGLYWYHDHIHHMAEKNVMQGLSGTLVIEGLTEQLPMIADMKEQIFVLKDYEIDDHPDPDFHKLIQTINGKTFSEIHMRPGEKQLWRLTNQSANAYFDLSLKDHKFHIIADDGVTLTNEIVVDTLKIKPASRYDVVVEAGDAGSYDLVSEGVITGQGDQKSSDRVLGHVIVGGIVEKAAASDMQFPTYNDLSESKIDERRTVVFTQLNDDVNFFIDGKLFDHDRIDTRVPLGNIEEWTIKNDTDDMHVFHIHQVSFQVTEINGVKQPLTGFVDNARVPERGEIKVILPFTDPVIVGKFMYHCHVLKHEDHGMMANIEVYDPKDDRKPEPTEHHH